MGSCRQGLGRPRRVVAEGRAVAACAVRVLVGLFAAVDANAQSPVAPASVRPAPAPLVSVHIEGDVIATPLAGLRGDPVRGREIVFSRDSNCVLCHQVPGGNPRSMGNLGPPIEGVGARLSEGQLRLRLVDSSRLVPESIMPAYYRVDGRVRVASAFAGKPVLDAQAIEDVVQYLGTLR